MKARVCRDFGEMRWRRPRATCSSGGRLRAAISQGCDLLIVDEIGPLELEQGRGLASLLSNLSARRLPPLLLVVRPELAGRLQERLPDVPFRTFTVTQENRQSLPNAIVKKLFVEHDRGR